MLKKELIQYKNEYYDNLSKFRLAYSKCIHSGIHISPTCIINKSKWRLVIEFKNKDGDVTEIIESDPKFYTSKEEYTSKMMNLYIHYAKDL